MTSRTYGILGVVVIALIAVVAFVVSRPAADRSPQQTSAEVNQNTNMNAEITSITIEPSESDAGWTMYTDEALLIVRGRNLKSVTAFIFPTGTGIGESYPNGVELGKLTVSGEDEWSFDMPRGILATNLWVVAETNDGRQLKSSDLGNVGYRD